MAKIALITGATGLVGKALVKLLLEKDYYSKIIVVSRRKLPIEDARIKTIILKDFDKMEDVSDQLDAHDHYCILGTTLKQARSKEMFKKIDLEWPLRLAKIAMKNPLFDQFLMVTSHGANAESPLFYNQIKGQVENELEKLGIRKLKIFQPSLLLGSRTEFRLGEETMKLISAILSFFMVGTRTRLWSIRDSEVAAAMFQTACRSTEGVEKFSPRKMIQLAK